MSILTAANIVKNLKNVVGKVMTRFFLFREDLIEM